MMIYLADAKPLDMVDFWIARAMLLLMAVLCAWLTFDTRHALILIRNGPIRRTVVPFWVLDG